MKPPTGHLDRAVMLWMRPGREAFHNLSSMASRVANRSTFAATGMNGQAYAKVSAFFLPLLGARAHRQTRKAPKTFHHLLSLRNAHFIEGRHECPPCCPGCTIDLGSLRVVSQQAAIHELIDRTASRIRNSFDPADELAQKAYLRLPCSLLLLSLESD